MSMQPLIHSRYVLGVRITHLIHNISNFQISLTWRDYLGYYTTVGHEVKAHKSSSKENTFEIRAKFVSLLLVIMTHQCCGSS